MDKRIKFIVMAIAFFILVIATAGTVLVALWNEDYLKAIFFLLLYGLYGGVAKALRDYGKKLIEDKRKEDNEKEDGTVCFFRRTRETNTTE